MGGYIMAVSGQRLRRHVPVAGQQIFIDATVLLQQKKRDVFT
jgi:hypothetical protein